jgi:hypothetical protein
MKVKSQIAIVSVLSACWTGALAADHPTTGSGATEPSNQVSEQAHKDAMSLKNDRLRKCKVMQGDEKKACEKDADADAKALVEHAGKDGAAEPSSKGAKR